MTKISKSLIFALFIGLVSTSLNAQELDPDTGLKIATGYETVKNNCTYCHGPSQITKATLSRSEWLDAIRWMQEEQGLMEFDEETEKEILDYLEANYS